MKEEKLKDLIVFDIESLVPGFNVEQTLEIAKKHKVLLYSSESGGMVPYIANATNEDCKILSFEGLTEEEKLKYKKNER